MIKKILVLLVLSMVFYSCSECDDCVSWDDPEFLQDATWSDDPNFNMVTIKNICDEKSPDLIISDIWFNCEDFKVLDYINNPPEECEEITLTDSNGVSHTGLFLTIIKDSDCN